MDGFLQSMLAAWGEDEAPPEKGPLDDFLDWAGEPRPDWEVGCRQVLLILDEMLLGLKGLPEDLAGLAEVCERLTAMAEDCDRPQAEFPFQRWREHLAALRGWQAGWQREARRLPCPACQTINEAHWTVCQQCGEALPDPEGAALHILEGQTLAPIAHELQEACGAYERGEKEWEEVFPLLQSWRNRFRGLLTQAERALSRQPERRSSLQPTLDLLRAAQAGLEAMLGGELEAGFGDLMGALRELDRQIEPEED